MSKSLTARQSQILDFVEAFQELHGSAPTLKEICDHFGFRSLSSARDHLRLIEKKGYLEKTPNSSRSIRLIHKEPHVESSQYVSVPLVGKIAAGSPIFALEEREDLLVLPKSLFKGRNLFALRVDGDSMVDAGIFDRDIAVLRSEKSFTDGEIAAVIIDEEATLKRVFKTVKGLRLQSENDQYADKLIPAAQMDRSCRIAGILIGTIRSFT